MVAKKQKKRTMSRSKQKPAFPPTAPRFPLVTPKQVINVKKIKDEAAAEAVRILEEKMKRIEIDAYNDAIGDAEKYFIIFGCRALYNQFGFGYKRLERFLDELMKLIETEDLDKTEKWLSDVGLRLVMSDIGDEVKKKGDKKDDT